MSVSIPHFGLARQYKTIKDELLDATNDVLSTGQLLNGSYTNKLEQWLCKKTKAKYAVVVHSGTQALEIIARYVKHTYFLGLSGDSFPKVRIPNLTYPATMNAFINAGCDIILGDTDKRGILSIQDYVSPVLNCVVGLYGMNPNPWAAHNSSTFVDGAQHWLVATHLGVGMAISFDPTKNLNASGNGGAIVTNVEELYSFAIDWRDNGKNTDHSLSGTNSKMSELDCSHVMVRAKYIDAWQDRRKYIASYWCDRFRELPLLCLSDTKEAHAHQKFVIYTPQRNPLHIFCALAGIESKTHYDYVLGDLPIAKDFEKPDMLSTSVMLSKGVVSLPLYPELTDTEVEYIAETVESFYKQ